MDGSLSNKPENFVDDLEKIYRQRRPEARSRKPELVDPKVEADDSSSSPQATPPTSPKEAPLHQGMALLEQECWRSLSTSFIPCLSLIMA